MATEAVPTSYVSKYGLEENAFMEDYKNGYTGKRYEIQPLGEYDKEDIDYRMKQNKGNIDDGEIVTVKMGSKEYDHKDGDESSDSRKKRNSNTRKRNRSDMSPDELRKLRERERKAQQSRRDRIRAQKVINNFFVPLFDLLRFLFFDGFCYFILFLSFLGYYFQSSFL